MADGPKGTTIRGAVAERTQTTRQGAIVKATDLAIEKMRKHTGWFAKVSPDHVDAERFVELGIAAVRRGTDQLKMALWQHPETFFDALAECARLGLVPGTEQFYFVPFRDGRDTVGTGDYRRANPDKGTYSITPIIGYLGMLDMIYRTGAVTAVHTYVVRKGDTFLWRPGLELPKHGIRPNEYGQEGLGRQADREFLTGVWSFANMTAGGTSKPMVMGVDAVLARRPKNRASAEFWGPEWPAEGPNTEAMWRKTAVRALY